MINRKDLEIIVKENNLLNEKQLISYVESSKKNGENVEDLLIRDKFVTPVALYEMVAKFYKLPFIDLKVKTIRPDVLSLVPEITAQAHKTIAFDKTDTELLIAGLDISNMELCDFLAKKTELKIKLHITTPEGIQEGLKHYHKGLNAEFKELESENKDNESSDKLKTLAQDLPVVRVVDTLLEYAYLEKASDIHIEPLEKEVIVRYRIDGILKKVMTLPKAIHAGVVARIKILSNLKIDEHRLPQDGRFKIKTNEYQVSFRVSIIPTFDGEKIVLRLLPDTNQTLTLKQLGLLPQALEILERNIYKPHGMILVTGPTGSGKTTTLYTIIGVLNKPEINISTVEDPIEYRMPGVNQSQIQPKIGYTFASALRAFLRQDPNIILVGETRDTETAEISINAAMTGHLVLTTLHTNDAVTAIPRLLDMNIPTFLLASTINLIIAQRLARKICKNCIESYNLDKKTITELEKQFDLDKVEKSLMSRGYLSKDQNIRSILFFRGKGCQICNNTGYKGRVGLYELLEVNTEMSELILQKASREQLESTAIKNGMTTIMQDGFIKAKFGDTTIEEVLRVTRE